MPLSFQRSLSARNVADLFHEDVPLTPAQWLAFAGLTNPDVPAVMALWGQAVNMGWSVSEGCQWIIATDRGDLVKPVVEQFGIDWAMELQRKGLHRDNGLTQALAAGGSGKGENAASDVEDRVASTVLHAWHDLGLNPMVPVPCAFRLMSNTSWPLPTEIQAPLAWLGHALLNHAWDEANLLWSDRRVQQDILGLSQALFVLSASESLIGVLHTDQNAKRREMEHLTEWTQRLLDAGARIDTFPWAAQEVRTTLKSHAHHVDSTAWDQAKLHHAWLPETAHFRSPDHAGPLWSLAKTVMFNHFNFKGRSSVLWGLLTNKQNAMETWAGIAALPNDGDGMSVFAVALSGRALRTQASAPEMDAIVLTPLVKAMPLVQAQDVLAALAMGLHHRRWESLRLLHKTQEQRPGWMPEGHLFDAADLQRLMPWWMKSVEPRIRGTIQGDQTTNLQHVMPEWMKNTKPRVRDTTQDDQTTNWWGKDVHDFASWLAPRCRKGWATWAADVQDAVLSFDAVEKQSPRDSVQLGHEWDKAILNVTVATADFMAHCKHLDQGVTFTPRTSSSPRRRL